MIWLNRAGHGVCNHTIHQNLDVYPLLDPFAQRLHIDFQVLQWSVWFCMVVDAIPGYR